MFNFGKGSEFEETGPDNGIFAKTQIVIKYNTRVFSAGSDVGGKVIELKSGCVYVCVRCKRLLYYKHNTTLLCLLEVVKALR